MKVHENQGKNAQRGQKTGKSLATLKAQDSSFATRPLRRQFGNSLNTRQFGNGYFYFGFQRLEKDKKYRYNEQYFIGGLLG